MWISPVKEGPQLSSDSQRVSKLLNLDKKFQFYSDSIIRKHRKAENSEATIARILLKRQVKRSTELGLKWIWQLKAKQNKMKIHPERTVNQSDIYENKDFCAIPLTVFKAAEIISSNQQPTTTKILGKKKHWSCKI